MSAKFMNYVGDIITDVDYHAMGDPDDYMEVHMDKAIPFRLYCGMRNEDWEEVTEEERLALIEKLKNEKAMYSKSDYRFYKVDFLLASLGGL